MITQNQWLKKLNTAALQSHTALGSNLRSLALQAKIHNRCSNNLHTTARDLEELPFYVTVIIFEEESNVSFIILILKKVKNTFL